MRPRVYRKRGPVKSLSADPGLPGDGLGPSLDSRADGVSISVARWPPVLAKERGGMAEHSDRGEQLRWLMQPPAKGDVRLVLELGDNARLTPAAQQALEQLLKELYDREVQGYVAQGAVNTMLLGRPSLQQPLQNCNLRCNGLDCTTFVIKRA